jgi:hypothetical protein
MRLATVCPWGEILGNTTVAAMLDRILHRSVVLNLDGDSYRLRDHHARTDALRRANTGHTRRPHPEHRHQVGKSGEQLWPRSTSAIGPGTCCSETVKHLGTHTLSPCGSSADRG